MSSLLLDKVDQFPKEPGVYLMKSDQGKIIYVGKAINLRSRVGNYFKKEADSRPQIRFLMNRVRDIDYLVTNNEKEALLLENSLIKKHKPRYNISLKDDKNYVSLKLSIKDEYPQLTVTRKIRRDGSLYFGPYTSALSCREITEFIYKHFRLRTCSDHELSSRTRPCLEYQIGRCSAPCVDYVTQAQYADQIKPVRLFLEGKNQELLEDLKSQMKQNASEQKFEEAAKYRDLIAHVETLLEQQLVVKHAGKHQDLVILYHEEDRALFAVLTVRDGSLMDSRYFPMHRVEEDDVLMNQFLGQYYLPHDFIPDEILMYPEISDTQSLAELLSERKGKKVILRAPQKGEKVDLIELGIKNAVLHFHRLSKKEVSQSEILTKLQASLGLSHFPERIECYDISNISGQHASASQVVFKNGEASKDDYRHYKIQFDEGPNDYAMMAEVLSRRFTNQDAEKYPQLLIVDGGRGQLGIALSVLKDLKIESIDVIGVAKGQGKGARAKGLWAEKKEEEIYLPNRKNPVILRRGSSELMLLQRVRDEAHRFAIKYHRNLRSKNLTKSFMDSIEGLGEAKKKALYRHFKSEAGIRSATVEQLQEVKGIHEELARRIHHLLKT